MSGTGQGRPLGRVILVGGGPGDPGLITVKGLAALQAADVVVADRLAPLQLLEGLSGEVEIVDAHKVPRGPFMPQERINRVLVERALEGRTVVRLKGGDPFVFGRGGEEIEACVAAGVPVEVIPGVTSAVAVPGLSGIPVTHRGVVQAFTVVSGHVPPGDPRSKINWPALAETGSTLIVMMGVASFPSIAKTLIASGLSELTPVACLQDGSGPAQRRLDATLLTIAEVMTREHVGPPAIFVVGDVAAFAAPPAR
jgi:uroporphyrin-III C-methyltransferase/precorrin-2 dehydrogenase/sirohydrochlorin ferrochelatase